MNVTGMTRAQAERAVAATGSMELLKLLGDHKNKHVRAKAAYKYKKLSQAQADAHEEAGR